jgi:hypothetical protein
MRFQQMVINVEGTDENELLPASFSPSICHVLQNTTDLVVANNL